MEKKKSIKKVLSSILVVLVVAALVIIPFALERMKDADEDKGSIHSAVASSASISKTVSGAGTLTDEEMERVKLPYGVEVTKYLVDNYDFVTEGQPLVEVDKVSVMTSINEYQKDLDYVQTQMARYTDTGATNFLTTASAGRVMAIYADEGDSINDVMLEHGALAVLSLDGLLAVDIVNDTLPVGSMVDVTAPDGSIASGHVESRKDGVIVITLSQNNRAMGETVTVTSRSGETIGSGELYVHSPLKITGYTGTIEAVHVKVDQDMFQGGTVFTYSGNSNSAEYDVYAAKHTELAGYIEDLFKMYTDGTVKAKCTGVISGIDEDAAAELLAAKGEPEATLDFLVNRGDTPQVMKTTAVEEKLFAEEPIVLPAEENEALSEETPVEEPEEDPTAQTEENPDTPPEDGSDVPTWPGEQPTEGESEQPTPSPQPTPVPTPQPTLYYRIGLVTNVIKVDSTLGHVRYTPSILYNGLDAIEVIRNGNIEWDTSLEARELDIPSYSVSMSNVPQELVLNPEVAAKMKDGKGKYLLECYVAGQAGVPEALIDIAVVDKNGNIVSPGGSSSKTDSASSGAAAKTPAYEYYSTKQTEVMDVTPQDTMTVDITVDELDILSIQRGQEVQITLDALAGQSFDGVITDIGVSGSNSGGNSKYIAEVTIDRASNMIAGMNATALITLSTSESPVTIPTDALVCEGTRTFVYTSYDSSNDLLGDPVDVVTGASDGLVTEIISGLSAGDTVWYTYLDKLDSGFDFPAMPMPGNN